MRRAGAMLVLGALALAACDCPTAEIAPGVYGAARVDDLGVTDYRLTVSADKTEVVESFVKDGRRFLVRYRAHLPQ